MKSATNNLISNKYFYLLKIYLCFLFDKSEIVLGWKLLDVCTEVFKNCHAKQK